MNKNIKHKRKDYKRESLEIINFALPDLNIKYYKGKKQKDQETSTKEFELEFNKFQTMLDSLERKERGESDEKDSKGNLHTNKSPVKSSILSSAKSPVKSNPYSSPRIDNFEKLFHQIIGGEENFESINRSIKSTKNLQDYQNTLRQKAYKLDLIVPDKFNICYNDLFSNKSKVNRVDLVRSPLFNRVRSEKMMKELQETERFKLKKHEEIKHLAKKNLNDRAKSLYFKDKLEKNFSRKYLDEFVVINQV